MEQLKYITFALAFLLSFSSAAQYAGYQYPDSADLKIPVYIGISGGLVSNRMVGSEIDFQKRVFDNTMSPARRGTFSLFVKNEVRPYLYLKWGLTYIQKATESPNNPTWKLNVKYLSLPFRVGFQPINFQNFSDDIQVALEVGASIDWEKGGTAHIKDRFSLNPTAVFNDQNFSALAGLNVEFRIFPRQLFFVNYTYYRDLRQFFSRYEQVNDTHYSARNQGWMLTGGLMFLLNKTVPKKKP